MRSRRIVAVLALITVTSSYGDDDGGDADLPLVGDIEPAVEALEDELGDAPQYYEIRATPLAVTLWVSADQGRRAIPYVFADGELADPEAAQTVDAGYTFAAADALTFESDHVLDQVVDDLDTPLTQLSIVGTEAGEPRMTVTAQSDRGGQLDIVLAPDGHVLETLTDD